MDISKNTHVVIAHNSIKRWYDNPDISCLMFALLSLASSRFSKISQCLHTYDRIAKKGLNGFQLRDNDKWRATELVEDLTNRIVYHPIVTITVNIPFEPYNVTNLNPKDVKYVDSILSKILNGIDGINGDNGVPAAIIIPILMQKDHFGTMVIKPAQKGQKPEVYYFNSLGTNHADYKYDEKLYFNFVEKRYGVELNKTLICNSEERWQTDGNQCGPFSIWFVGVICNLIEKNNLNAESVKEVFHNIWKMGVGHNEEKVQEVRNSQAKLLQGCGTNFSTSLFLQFKSAIRSDSKWHDLWDNTEFDNLVPKKPWEQQKTLMNNGKEVIDVEGIDAFELQKETGMHVLSFIQNQQRTIKANPNTLNNLTLGRSPLSKSAGASTKAPPPKLYSYSSAPAVLYSLDQTETGLQVLNYTCNFNNTFKKFPNQYIGNIKS